MYTGAEATLLPGIYNLGLGVFLKQDVDNGGAGGGVWSVAELAHQAGISRQRLYALIRKGRAPSWYWQTPPGHLRGRIVFPKASAREWILRRPAPAEVWQ